MLLEEKLLHLIMDSVDASYLRACLYYRVEGSKLAVDHARARDVDLSFLTLPIFLPRSQVCCNPEHTELLAALVLRGLWFKNEIRKGDIMTTHIIINGSANSETRGKTRGEPNIVRAVMKLFRL